MRLIPSIDLRGGKCVRLLRGDFDAETQYPDSPEQVVKRYRELGAQWIHVVDLDGAKDGVVANRKAISAMAAQQGLSLQVGGGIRTSKAVDDLLAAGVTRVVVGSAAVEEPDEVLRWLARVGSDRLCIAFDVRASPDGKPRVTTRGWTRSTSSTLWEMVERFVPGGLKHVLCTDTERDGALTGPSLTLYTAALKRFPNIEWQASGGIRDVADLDVLSDLGMAAAISGRAMIENRISPADLRRHLAG